MCHSTWRRQRKIRWLIHDLQQTPYFDGTLGSESLFAENEGWSLPTFVYGTPPHTFQGDHNYNKPSLNPMFKDGGHTYSPEDLPCESRGPDQPMPGLEYAAVNHRGDFPEPSYNSSEIDCGHEDQTNDMTSEFGTSLRARLSLAGVNDASQKSLLMAYKSLRDLEAQNPPDAVYNKLWGVLDELTLKLTREWEEPTSTGE
jgi:hypothetical protein